MIYIRVKQATKLGFIRCQSGGVFDASYPKSELRRGRVQSEGMVCPTLTTGEPNILRITVTKGGDADVIH